MNPLIVLLISISLNFDSFAIAVLCGLILKKPLTETILRIGISFALPQGFLFLVGWFGGLMISGILSSIDYWIAFVILGIVGIRLIYEGVRSSQAKEEAQEQKINPLNRLTLLGLGFATSFDALAVGVGYGLLNPEVLVPFIMIIIVTFIVVCIGVYLGGRFNKLPNEKVLIVGGFILVGLGVYYLINGLLLK